MSFARIAADHPLYREIQSRSHDREPPWVRDALTIIEGLDARNEYSFSELCEICDKPELDKDLLIATNVLAGWPEAIFDIALFLRHDDTRIYLDKEQAQAALNGEDITHPATGEKLTDPQSQTYISYRLIEGL